MKKILLIGPLPNKYDSSKTGGITILFELFLEELQNKNIQFDVIDTLKENNGGGLKTLIKTWLNLILNINKYEYVSLHSTKGSFITVAPLLVFLSKLFSKKSSIRVFAGSFSDTYHHAGIVKKFMIRSVLRNVDTVFFELKSFVTEFKCFNPNIFWFPNVRKNTLTKKKERIYNKRFVYIGSINEEKGIDDICAIVNKLDNDITFDLYGPILEEKYTLDYFTQKGVSYKGALRSEEVQGVMDQYDILVLPSYREGYPGVIIEAFLLGLPVITTKLSGIMEICIDGKNALLIEAGDKEGLLKAISHMTQDKYTILARNASASFDDFDSEKQTDLFLKRIEFTN